MEKNGINETQYEQDTTLSANDKKKDLNALM